MKSVESFVAERNPETLGVLKVDPNKSSKKRRAKTVFMDSHISADPGHELYDSNETVAQSGLITQTGGPDLGDNDHKNIRETYMEGDSYPDTTSGRLTEDDGPVASHSTERMVLPQHPQPLTRLPDLPEPQRFSRPAEPDVAPFLYQAPPVSNQRHQAPQEDARSPQPMSALAKPVSKAKKSNGKKARHQRSGSVQSSTSSANRHKRSHSDVFHNDRGDVSHQSCSHDTHVQHGASSDKTQTSGVDHGIDLDHDMTDLQRMQYSELKEESFDIDPRDNVAALESAELQIELERVTKSTEGISREILQRFFSHMTIAQWEEAGRYINKETQRVIEEMAKIRQQKRDLSIQFELEVNDHYDSILQKQKAIEEAAKTMRSRGLDMLGSKT